MATRSIRHTKTKRRSRSGRTSSILARMVDLVPPSPSDDGPDLQDADVVANLFDQATKTNLGSPLRHGSIIELPETGTLTITGDLHDNTPNLKRIIKLAGLHDNKSSHLILHEVVHGPHLVNKRDLSVRTLAWVAWLILQAPDRVHLMQANHELAQLGGEGILKGGVSVVDAFNCGVEYLYDEQAEEVTKAMKRFIASLPLAVRCSNGVFVSHSLPSPRHIDGFDTKIIKRKLKPEDLAPGGHAYNMVWGRKHTQELADTLAKAWETKIFVTGHQPVDELGYLTEGDSILVLASDDNHGVALPIDLSKTYTLDDLIERLVPLASVVV